jgi:PAS domain S-box-containing protein
MKDEGKTKKQLINELKQLRRGIAQLEVLEAHPKRADEEIQRSKEFIETVMNSITDSISIIDTRNFKVIGANKAFLQSMKMKQNEVIGKTCDELIHRLPGPCGAPEYICPLSETVKTGRPASVEHVHWDPEGHRICVETSAHPVKDEKGEVCQVIHVKRDITNRKKAEDQIIRAKNEWERTFNAVPDLIMILDNEHRIVRANKAMADRLHCSPEDLVGSTCYEIVHGTETPPAFCPHARLLADGLEHRGEAEVAFLGGYFLVSVSPLHGSDGSPGGSVHVAREITKRKGAEEALQKARDELERRVEERTAKLRQEIRERKQVEEALRESESHLRYLSSQLLTAHEDERKRIALELHDSIGQTLSALKFSVESSLKQMGDSDIRACAQAFERTIPLIQESIEEVRKIAMELRPSVLDDLGILATISWFCREFQKIYSVIRIKQQIGVQEHEIPGPLKTVIYRILQEALNNVAKHSEADVVRLSLRKRGGTLELAVEDNGLGFNPKERFSLKNSTRGFGLASMKERTQLSGGSFSIKSAKGAGTTVRARWGK